MRKIVSPIIIVLLWSCAPNPYRTSNKMYKAEIKNLAEKLKQKPPGYVADSGSIWIGTTNFDLRKPNFVIIHHTAQNSCEQTLHTFTITRSQVSAHYVICKDGTVHHMLNDYLRAWQAGVSKWGNNTDINSSSIGIEIDNNGFEPFTDMQISNLILLLDTLKKKYNIPTPNFIGHGDIAPGRKVDPNWRFPWKTLADSGFGNWFGDTTNLVVPPNFDYLLALRVIGYDMKDTTAVIAAFKRHWLQDTINIHINDADMKILYTLSKKM
ncbi:MAG: N-acetylmuramoyl-L-alanine amidase [Bacteroidetes bacterium]|nr:N-acetylmuramoyl-L-alanine amidase [Bacteroidota bacterium]